MKYLELGYEQKCLNVYSEGGTLYLLERTDNNNFCAKTWTEWKSNDTYRPFYTWSNKIGFFTVFFLTKEDAEEFLKVNKFMEGGCSHCHHNSTEIPINITEHEFIPYKNRPLVFEK